jgi:hypothetical protein
MGLDGWEHGGGQHLAGLLGAGQFDFYAVH